MSDLLGFDDNDDLFVPDNKDKNKKPTRNLDDIFGSTDSTAQSTNTLDDIFTVQPSDDIFTTQTKPANTKSKADELFGPEADDDFDFFSGGGSSSQSTGAANKTNTTSTVDDLFDIFSQAPPPMSSDTGDSMDLLLANNNESDSKLKSKEESHDSLDLLLDAQPDGAVPQSDDLMSIFNRYSGEPAPTSSSLAEKETPVKTEQSSAKPNYSDAFNDGVSHDDNLDMLLDAQSTGTVPPSDDTDGPVDTPSFQQETKEQKTTDKTNLPVKLDSKPDNSDSTLAADSKEESHDSLDMLLDAQPMGMVPPSDDLMSMVNRYTNDQVISSNKVAGENKKASSQETDPLDDFFGTSEGRVVGEVTGPSEKEEPDTVAAPVKPRTNLKKSMERSFEDLLTGLSDESEPELDDMIEDGNDNTNLESLLQTPNKSLTQQTTKRNTTSTPYASIKSSVDTDLHKDSLLEDYDFASMKPKHSEDTDVPKDSLLEDYDFGSMSTPSQPFSSAPEVKLHTPEDDNQNSLDVKSWEMVDAEDTEDQHQAVDKEVVMRHRNGSYRSQSESEDIDLSAIEDTNHLDVDLSKQKSALGKKGSLALRRKPSRKSRKSLMSTGDEAIFQDSTDPKPSSMLNGEDDDDDKDKDEEAFDLSPPAKKHSPSMMVPLPGFPTKPPPRLSATSPEDEEMEPPKEAKRISKPPPGAFRLPPVMPKLNKTSPTDTPGRSGTDSSPHEFERPVLKTTQQRDSKTPEHEAQTVFETPVLKRTGAPEGRRQPASEERDMTFEKPALRSTPKPGLDRKDEERMDTTTGVFEKPQLRNTSSHQTDRFTKQTTEKPAETFEPRMLRSTPKREINTRQESDTHTFDKPQLKSTGKAGSIEDKTEYNTNQSAKTFEKPVLRTAQRDTYNDSNDTPKHTFDKPSLKNTPTRLTYEADNTKKDHFTTGVFEKPSLRKATPSPEKEVKLTGELKGTFDKPSLRRTEGSRITEQNAKTNEKPSWLQTAAEKQTKVFEALHTKENHTTSSEKSVPGWLDNHPARKNIGGLPLQETSSNKLDSSRSTTPRSRESSIGSDSDSIKKKTSTGDKETHNNYAPSWMRQGRSPSSGTLTGISPLTPAKSCPSLTTDEIPQWKRDLAQRRQSKKDSPSTEELTVDTEELPKKEEKSEPEWKKNIQLRKVQTKISPTKESHSVEPEWMKKAEEKRARLRKSAQTET